jgi:hypothetical protein
MMVGYSTDHNGNCCQMWDPVTGGVHDTRDVTWMHRMFFERQVSHGIVIPPMIIQGIDETPIRSGEGIDEDTEDGINVETVIEDDDEKDAESELPMEGDANVMGNPTAQIEGVNQTRSGRTIKPPERLIQEIGAFAAQGATAAANYEIALTAAEIQYYDTMKGLTLLLLARWYAELIDVKGAFLHGEFDEGEILYMEIPQGFKQYYPAEFIWLLLRTIYGLKQAAVAFWKQLILAFASMNYRRSKADPCLYFDWTRDGLIVWIYWVDDCLVAGKKKGVIVLQRAK